MANASLVVIGAGGNIGSHLVPHLGRLPGVARVTLVDPDIYEEKNLACQDILRRDVGKPKAEVQARRLQSISSGLAVRPIVDAVENVPLGLMRASVVLACLDSRAARRSVNFVVGRLGLPWIDSGVNGKELLARVNVYLPGPDQPCFECALSERDYESMEQSYPCVEDAAPRATNAPSALGALAASLQAIECQKLLDGRWGDVAVGKQVTISALAHRLEVTRFLKNSACRFDHSRWKVATLARRPKQVTVGGLFELVRDSAGANGSLRFQVPQQMFATALVCPACGQRRDVSLRLLGRLSAAERACDDCGKQMRAAGTDLHEWLPEADLAPDLLGVSLQSLGMRRGDVFTVADSVRTMHFEIGVAR